MGPFESQVESAYLGERSDTVKTDTGEVVSLLVTTNEPRPRTSDSGRYHLARKSNGRFVLMQSALAGMHGLEGVSRTYSIMRELPPNTSLDDALLAWNKWKVK